MKIPVVFLWLSLLLAPALADPTSPLEIANLPVTKRKLPESPIIDIGSIGVRADLLDSDYLTEKLNSISKSLVDCAKGDYATAADKFHNCAGPSYEVVDSHLSKFLGQSNELVLKKFTAQLSGYCAGFAINSCYEVQSAVRFAVMNGEDPVKNVEKLFSIEKLPQGSELKAALENLKRNYGVFEELSHKTKVQKQHVVDEMIQVWRQEGLADSLGWRDNPFALSHEEVGLLEKAGVSLKADHHGAAFTSDDALQQEKKDEEDVQKANVFGAGGEAGAALKLKEAAKQLDSDDIRLNALQHAALFPVPSEEEMKEMARLDPDLTLTTKQKRQLKIVRHINIV